MSLVQTHYLRSVMMGCFAAGTVLVSFGAVIGKVSPLQLLALTMIEVPVYFANFHVGVAIIHAVDCGMHTYVQGGTMWGVRLPTRFC